MAPWAAFSQTVEAWHAGTIIFVNMKNYNVRAGPGASLQKALQSLAGDLSL